MLQMEKERKVYDFNPSAVSSKLVTAFKKNKRECTVADLIRESALPKYQVETALRSVVDEFGGHMKVTESGELLYYFPNGMVSRDKSPQARLKKAGQKILKAIAGFLTLAFKVWIMVMLVGYFVLFVVLAIAALVLSMSGGSKSNDNRSSRRGGGGGFFVMQMLFRLFLYSSITAVDERIPQNRRGRPLHKNIFAFVFGEEDKNSHYYTELKQSFIAWVQNHKGIITSHELKSQTGMNDEESQVFINRMLLEMEGDVCVTDTGTIYYYFPELLRTASGVRERAFPRMALYPFNNNKSGLNKAIGFFNGFNLAFGSFFLFFPYVPAFATIPVLRNLLLIPMRFMAGMGIADPAAVISVGLGVVPLVFSLLFFIIPAVRQYINKRKNTRVKTQNFRRKITANLLANPLQFNPASVKPVFEDEIVRNPASAAIQITDEWAGSEKAEILENPDKSNTYRFEEVYRQHLDIAQQRGRIKLEEFLPGKTIFDSGK